MNNNFQETHKQLNEEILQFLLKYREVHPSFKFATRVVNRGNKLNEGYWFQGTENYIFVGFYKVGDGKSKTKTIGFVIELKDGAVVNNHVSIVYPMDLPEEVVSLHKRIKDRIDSLHILQLKEIWKNNRYVFMFESTDWKENLSLFLDKIQPEINTEIKASHFEKEMFISDDHFKQNFSKIASVKNNISDDENLIKLLRRIGKHDSLKYFEYASRLMTNLNISEGDARISYTCRDFKRLAIIIGHRDCFVYLLDDSMKLNWGFILQEQIQNDAIKEKGVFKETNGVISAYYHTTDDNANIGLLFDGIYTACKFELERTNKSHNKKSNVEVFEKAIFDDDFRRQVFEIAFIEFPKSMNKYPLNQILYGPPGTGKTYNSINHAVAIIENTDIESIKLESRKDVLRRFEAYKQKGLIQFVTFHQSFNYEDFVEGIKPKTIGEENQSTVIYEIEDGVFKTIANNANSVGQLVQNYEGDTLHLSDSTLNRVSFYKTSLGNSQDSDDDVIYDYCKENNVIAVGWGDDIDFSGVATESELKELFLSNDYKPTDFALIAIKCLKFWMQKDDIVFISNGNSRVRAIGQITGDYFYNNETEIRYNHFRPVKWLATNLNIPVEMVYEKKFSQQSIYGMYKEQVKKEFFQKSQKSIPDNYVLIIDEINRGNVSQIFGELITLLEEDKRIDAEDGMPLTVTLPYSKKSFSVPKNLFIVGTMNTADRSVEALDTALRRRFSFQEMTPNYGLNELNYEVVPGVSANDLLKTINSRIEKLLDKDHLIGHSFFMNKSKNSPLNNVIDAFYRNIIPLLQEYFFGDYGKIGLILGQGFVKLMEAENETIFAKFDYDIETRDVYEIIDHRGNHDDFKLAVKQLMNRN